MILFFKSKAGSIVAVKSSKQLSDDNINGFSATQLSSKETAFPAISPAREGR